MTNQLSQGVEYITEGDTTTVGVFMLRPEDLVPPEHAATLCSNESNPDYLPLTAYRVRPWRGDPPPAMERHVDGDTVTLIVRMQPVGARPLPPVAVLEVYLREGGGSTGLLVVGGELLEQSYASLQGASHALPSNFKADAQGRSGIPVVLAGGGHWFIGGYMTGVGNTVPEGALGIASLNGADFWKVTQPYVSNGGGPTAGAYSRGHYVFTLRLHGPDAAVHWMPPGWTSAQISRVLAAGDPDGTGLRFVGVCDHGGYTYIAGHIAATNQTRIYRSATPYTSLSWSLITEMAPPSAQTTPPYLYSDGTRLRLVFSGMYCDSLDGGTTWTGWASAALSSYPLAAGAGQWVAAGASGKLLFATGGGSFSEHAVPGLTGQITGIAFDGASFLAVSTSGQALAFTGPSDIAFIDVGLGGIPLRGVAAGGA